MRFPYTGYGSETIIAGCWLRRLSSPSRWRRFVLHPFRYRFPFHYYTVLFPGIYFVNNYLYPLYPS